MVNNCSSKNNKATQIAGESFKLNYRLKDLCKLTLNHENNYVFYYILKSVKNINHSLVQIGTGPNIEGEVISLCTCKHKNRTSENIKEGSWIAGISNKENGNFLFYLMKIQKTFQNQKNLYEYYLKNNLYKSIKIKDANKNNYGDLFIPLRNIKDPYNPLNYTFNNKEHCHFEGNEWYDDIMKYELNVFGKKYLKEHKLLLGNSSLSFVWTKGDLKYDNELTLKRQNPLISLHDFLNLFKQL
ncbi:hypothetical protein BH10BAC5_BH10BAC5_15790 [soil metagenome]